MTPDRGRWPWKVNVRPRPKQKRGGETRTPAGQGKSSQFPHQLQVAGGPVPVQNSLVLGRHSQIQGLGVGRQGALVVPTFE